MVYDKPASDPFDPVEGGSANNYDYVNGDPINGYDLDGNVCWSYAARHVKNAGVAVGKTAWKYKGEIALGVCIAATDGACAIANGALLGASVGVNAAHIGRACLGGRGCASAAATGIFNTGLSYGAYVLGGNEAVFGRVSILGKSYPFSQALASYYNSAVGDAIFNFGRQMIGYGAGRVHIG